MKEELRVGMQVQVSFDSETSKGKVGIITAIDDQKFATIQINGSTLTDLIHVDYLNPTAVKVAKKKPSSSDVFWLPNTFGGWRDFLPEMAELIAEQFGVDVVKIDISQAEKFLSDKIREQTEHAIVLDPIAFSFVIADMIPRPDVQKPE